MWRHHLHSICTTTAQRLRRWSNVVQMLYTCFVFAGLMWHTENKLTPDDAVDNETGRGQQHQELSSATERLHGSNFITSGSKQPRLLLNNMQYNNGVSSIMLQAVMV